MNNENFIKKFHLKNIFKIQKRGYKKGFNANLKKKFMQILKKLKFFPHKFKKVF